ncbi:MAG: AEC family transporter, partial [Christensenellales bacterium]
MIVLFEKMAMLVILLALGYLCARMKLVGPEFNKGLSKLVMNLFLVGMILSSVINKDMELSGSEALTGFLMLALMVLICLGIGFISPTVLRIKNGDRGMYRMLVSFMNNGFMGFPLVAAIYGEGAVFFASLSNIPFNLLLYSVGVMFLREDGQREKFKLKDAINTPMIATLIAVIIFVYKIPMPMLIEDTVDTIAAA